MILSAENHAQLCHYVAAMHTVKSPKSFKVILEFKEILFEVLKSNVFYHFFKSTHLTKGAWEYLVWNIELISTALPTLPCLHSLPPIDQRQVMRLRTFRGLCVEKHSLFTVKIFDKFLKKLLGGILDAILDATKKC